MNDEQLLRYSRQILLPQIDLDGQARLLASRALILGAGGLGAPAAMYLAAAGVGTLVIADGDQVDLSNLQRQVIHHTDSIGRLKVDSASDTLKRLNPEVEVIGIPERLADVSLSERVAAVDVVLDCSDNFATRFAVNQACVAHRVPLVSGAVIRFEGQIAVFDSRTPENPCYHCLYPDSPHADPDQNCARNGVIAPLPGVIGGLQALEAIKLLVGGPSLAGRLLLFDAWSSEWTSMRLKRHPACPTCSPSADPARSA